MGDLADAACDVFDGATSDCTSSTANWCEKKPTRRADATNETSTQTTPDVVYMKHLVQDTPTHRLSGFVEWVSPLMMPYFTGPAFISSPDVCCVSSSEHIPLLSTSSFLAINTNKLDVYVMNT